LWRPVENKQCSEAAAISNVSRYQPVTLANHTTKLFKSFCDAWDLEILVYIDKSAIGNKIFEKLETCLIGRSHATVQKRKASTSVFRFQALLQRFSERVAKIPLRNLNLFECDSVSTKATYRPFVERCSKVFIDLEIWLFFTFAVILSKRIERKKFHIWVNVPIQM